MARDTWDEWQVRHVGTSWETSGKRVGNEWGERVGKAWVQ